MNRLALIAAPLLVAGCSSQSPTPQPTPVATTAPAPVPVPSATPTPVASPTKSLPAPLIGAWTADKTGDCTADNELRIDVRADRIDFYESRATITGVTQVDPHSWGVDATVTGEGETWQKSFDLNLNENGTMTRVEGSVPDITYTRCPKGA